MEAIQNSHTDSLDKLSTVCRDLAKTVGDINTTQAVAMEILRAQQREIEEGKKHTQVLFSKASDFQEFRSQFSGGKLILIGALMFVGWLVTNGISAWIAMKTH